MRAYLQSLAIVLFCVAGAPVASAQDAINPILEAPVELQLGAQWLDTDASVLAVVDPLPETEVDLDDLGIDDTSTVFWVSARWRFAERWNASFTYNQFDEDGGGTVEDSFNFDGDIYPAGVNIDTSLKLDAYILDVTYSFGKTSNYEWGAGLGLHAFDFEAGISGELFVGGDDAEFLASTDSLLAPVPNLRVFADYAFDARNAIRFNAGWLSANYEDYDGRLLYASLRYDHIFGENFGVGAGLQYTDVDLEHDPGGASREEYNVTLTGVVGYISYRF